MCEVTSRGSWIHARSFMARACHDISIHFISFLTFSPIVLSFLLTINFIFDDVVDKFPVHTRWWGPWHSGRERASHRLWAQRPLHHGGFCRIHPGVLGRAAVPKWLRLRWRHHRQDAPWCVPKASRSLWRRLVVLSVVVSQSWLNGETRCLLHIWFTSFKCPRNSETQLRKRTDEDSLGATKRADSRWLKKYSKVEWDDRVARRRNLSDSSKKRTTSTRSSFSSWTITGTKNWDLREAHERSLSEMEELKRFQGSTFDTIARRKLVEDRDTILDLTGKVQELQNEVNCMNDSRDFQDAESVRSGHSHVASRLVSFPPHPVPGGMLGRSPGMRAAKMGRQVFGTHVDYRETFLQIQQRLLQHLIRKSQIHGILMYQNTLTHHMWWRVRTKHRFRIRDASLDRQPKIQSSQWVRIFEELWCRPTTTADFRSSFRQNSHASNICLLEDKIQAWCMYLFTISYGSCALDQKSGVGWFSGWSQIFVFCRRNSNAEFEVLDAKIASALNRIIQNTRLRNKKAQKEDRFFRGRQIAYLIYEYFRVIGANDSVENYADLFTVVLQNDDIPEFDSKWDGILNSMTKIPSDDILDGLWKLRIRESDQLKNVLELYNTEIHQKKAGPDYHRLKTLVKRSIEQEIRNKNFGARSGNYERIAVVKNQVTKQREQRTLGDCWQRQANGQCSEGDNCSFRHDINKRGKMTQPNPSPRSSTRQNERNASRTKGPRGKESQWKNVSMVLQGLPQRNLHQFILWKVAPSSMLVLQVGKWMQIRGEVLWCASPGWRTA